jgi:hypothetical protein
MDGEEIRVSRPAAAIDREAAVAMNWGLGGCLVGFAAGAVLTALAFVSYLLWVKA